MMLPLEYLSVARFRGPDAGNFLQNQLSADIAALGPGDAGFACCCTPKGQVIGLLLVCRQDDDFLVAGSAGLLPGILTRLKMFVFRARVEFLAEPDMQVYGALSAGEPGGPAVFQPAGLNLGYRFSTGKELQENPGHGIGTGEDFKAAEISRGVVWLDGETSEKFIPQMLGFEQIGAVSFSKGCYPGQEIVARARYLGKVKRKPLVVQTVESCPAKPASTCSMRVDFPIPGSPPISTSEPGTRPPPKTRSNSAMEVINRSSDSSSIESIATGTAAGTIIRPELLRPRPAAAISSTMESHLPQSGHLPSHLGDW